MKLGIKLLRGCLVLAASTAWSAPASERPAFAPVEEMLDVNAPIAPVAGKVLQDTTWIADWSFDTPGGDCTDAGWVKYDNRVLNDGSNYWSVSTDYAGAGGGTITNFAAVLRKQDFCSGNCAYDDNWDYSIVLQYSGLSATLAFKFVADTEAGFDFVKVEGDSLGLSEARVDYSVNPSARAADYREEVYTNDGDLNAGVIVGPLALPNFGPGTHEVYIRFVSDGAASPCSDFPDIPPFLGAAIIVDDIAVTGGTAYSENFECGAIGCLNPNVQLLNTAGRDAVRLVGTALPAHHGTTTSCNENRDVRMALHRSNLHRNLRRHAVRPGCGRSYVLGPIRSS